MLSHRIRPVSEILAPHVEHLWVVRGYLPAQERVAVGADRKKPWLEKFPDFPVFLIRIQDLIFSFSRKVWSILKRLAILGNFCGQTTEEKL